jgi:hypothetical protein
MAKANNNRVAKKSDVWLIDPSEICIVGGAGVLKDDEAADIDTAEDVTHPLYDERVRLKLDPAMVLNVEAFGVIKPVVIARLDGVDCAVDGRRRIRSARVVNALRKARGEKDKVMVPCVVRRTDQAGLTGAMISANGFSVADDPATKIAKMKRHLERTSGDTAQAAVACGVPESTIKSWIAYDEKATPAVKKAVDSGKIDITGGVLLARKDPEAQAAALDDAIAAGAVAKPRKGQEGKASVAAVRKAIKKRGGTEAYEAPGKAELRKLLAFIAAEDHSKSSDKMKAWADGVEDALRLVVGPEEGQKVSEKIAARLANALEPEAK